MKLLNALLLMAVVVISPIHLQAKTAAESGISVKMERLAYAETLGKNTQYVFIMGESAYRTVEELKKGVERLPKGSGITWALGCIMMGNEPLRSSEELEDFQKHCAAHGIKWTVIPSA